jgi:hypothetical protein
MSTIMPALQSNVVVRQSGLGASGILKRTFRSRHSKQSSDKLASPLNSPADISRLSVLVDLTVPPSRNFATGGPSLVR